jgi:hypothetical protein
MTEKAGWRDYFEAMGGVLGNSTRRLRVVLRRPTIWMVWPFHALLIYGVMHQKPNLAFWWVIPESFPFQSSQHFKKRMMENPIDAPQVILDWIKEQPYEAGVIPIWIIGFVITASFIEVLWLSALLGDPLKPKIGRSFNAAWQWLLLRAVFAVIFLPVALVPAALVFRSLLGGGGVAPEQQAMALLMALLCGMWAMIVMSIWRLINQWLQQLWLPLRLIVGGSLAGCWRYAKQLAKTHWRGLAIFTIAEWAIITVLGGFITVATLLLGFAFGERVILRDLTAAVILLPLWAWMRLLGAAAIGRLHPNLAATPELAPPQD